MPLLLTIKQLIDRYLWLLLLLVALYAQPAFAQGVDITRADWIDRLPVFFIVVIVVLAVDWLFIRKILRDRRENQDRIE